MDSRCLGQLQVAGCFERGNVISSYSSAGNFLASCKFSGKKRAAVLLFI
jgi:hypothetical protein